MKSCILLLCVSFAMTLPSAAQTTGAQSQSWSLKEQVQARAEILPDLKNGDTTSAIAKLRARARKGLQAPAEDVQVVTELCALASLEAASDGNPSVSTVQAIVNEAGKAKRKLSQSESAYIDAQVGEVFERAVGSSEIAKQYYQSALAKDATRQDAANGLQRLRSLEELQAAKEKENSELRLRGK